MGKRNTIEVDEAEDLLDENLVDEELDNLLMEESVQDAFPSFQIQPAQPDVVPEVVVVPSDEPRRRLVSRQTQTVTIAHLQEPSNVNLVASVQSLNTVRTLTRHMRTKRGTIKKPAQKSTVEDAEEEIDNFNQLEAGTSDARESGRFIKLEGSGKHRPDGSKHRPVGSKHRPDGSVNFAVGFKKSLNRSLSRAFTLSRFRPMSSKERVRRDNRRAGLSRFQLIMHDLKLYFERQKNEKYEFPLFLKRIKSIQGELGSSTAALFVFVRYLLMINIVAAIFWVLGVVVPQAVNFDYDKLANNDDDGPFTGVNLFLGTEKVSKSWLFFSGYSENIGAWGYQMYVAYLLIHLISLLLVLVGILKTISTDIIREGSQTDDRVKSLAMNLFTAWDYSINSHDAVAKQQKSMGSNFKDLLCELTSAKKERTVRERRIMYGLRLLAWFIWVLLVTGSIVAIVMVVENTSSNETDLWNVYGPTIVLTIINVAVPFLMQQLPLIESYDVGRLEQQTTLFRVWVMRMVSLITFIVSMVTSEDVIDDCKQLYWGQEFYKLIIIGTFSNCMSLAKYPAFYYLLNRKNEVDLPSTLMSLIYFQGQIWFGNLFCPLLSCMGIISNLVYFGIASSLIKKCCQPPTKRYNTNNSAFFNAFLALTIVIMIVLSLWIILTENVNCGPWQSPKFATMWDTWAIMSSDWNEQIKNILEMVVNPIALVAVIFVLVMLSWFISIKKEKLSVRNDVLQSEIDLARQDKIKYLKEQRDNGKKSPE